MNNCIPSWKKKTSRNIVAFLISQTVMTFKTPPIMKVINVSLTPDPSPARGRGEIRESLARLSELHARMIDLPDANVWLALVDGNHTHHLAASHYWNQQSGTQMAFCRVSMLGFLRLSTQPRVLSRTLSHAEAWHI